MIYTSSSSPIHQHRVLHRSPAPPKRVHTYCRVDFWNVPASNAFSSTTITRSSFLWAGEREPGRRRLLCSFFRTTPACEPKAYWSSLNDTREAILWTFFDFLMAFMLFWILQTNLVVPLSILNVSREFNFVGKSWVLSQEWYQRLYWFRISNCLYFPRSIRNS